MSHKTVNINAGGLKRKLILVPIVAIIAASAICNGIFGFVQGSSTHIAVGALMAGIAIMADCFKPFVLPTAARQFANRAYGRAIAFWSIYPLLVLLSAFAAIGFSSMVKTGDVAQRGDSISKRAEAEKTIAEQRVAYEKASIAADAWLRRGRGCNHDNVKRIPAKCYGSKWREFDELAKAAQERIADAKAVLLTTKAHTSDDPMADTIASATGISKASVQLLSTLVIAAVVELISGFGLFGMSTPEAPKAPRKAPGETRTREEAFFELQELLDEHVNGLPQSSLARHLGWTAPRTSKFVSEMRAQGVVAVRTSGKANLILPAASAVH